MRIEKHLDYYSTFHRTLALSQRIDYIACVIDSPAFCLYYSNNPMEVVEQIKGKPLAYTVIRGTFTRHNLSDEVYSYYKTQLAVFNATIRNN